MATMRAQFQRTLFPGIDLSISKGFEEKEEQYSMIMNVMDSDSAFEEDMTAAGVGLFVQTPEGVQAAEDQFLPGFNKRYTHDDFTQSIGFTHQMIRDGKVSFWNERGSDLGYSCRQTIEVLVADELNQGFTNVSGPDGKSLFATDHPNIRQGTQSNILDPVATIGVLSVRAALTKFRRFFDHTGVRRIRLMPEYLVHPPEEEYNVLEILKSAGRPDTANRADNVIKGALKPFTYDYLTDPKFWFVSATKSRHKLKVFFRERFHTTEFEDEKARTNWVQAMFAMSHGFSDWLGWLGSNPV